MSRGKPYLHVTLLYRKFLLQVSVNAVPREDLKVLVESLTMTIIMEKRENWIGNQWEGQWEEDRGNGVKINKILVLIYENKVRKHDKIV
jgi:hypothetical protein